MELFTDSGALLGFVTLVVLEIILGIDNLIFIAILADKLPPEQRDKARTIGLGLALLMRIALLFGVAWLVTLTSPYITINEKSFSIRDLILISGGVFLLLKATIELHERVEGSGNQKTSTNLYSSFYSIIAQIVILDAVFSIDSVITAIGMVDDISIMITAVVIAVAVMMIASKPLTTFVNANPTLIVLCLGFLLMIGLSLITEGFGISIPKGYLYAAIGFSLIVEIFNQLVRINRKKVLSETKDIRDSAIQAVLRLLGGKNKFQANDLAIIANINKQEVIFHPMERKMIELVLNLAEFPVKSVITPYKKLHIIDINSGEDIIRDQISNSPFTRLIVMNKSSNEFLGFVQKKDVLNLLTKGKKLSLLSIIQKPLAVDGGENILSLLENLKKADMQLAFIMDKNKNFIGIVTLADIMKIFIGAIK